MFWLSRKSPSANELRRSQKPPSSRRRDGRALRIEGLEPRLAMNGTWATPAGTLSLDSNLNLWVSSNANPGPTLVAQNVENVKVGNGSNYAAIVTTSGALERFDTSQPTVGPALLAAQIASFAVDPIEDSSTPSGNLPFAADFSWSSGVSPNGDTYALVQSGSLERFAIGSSAPIVVGNFAVGSPLVIDGSGSPAVLDRGNNHLYRYIPGSGVWSDIGNFAAGSPLDVDGSGSPMVLDRGNGNLYRYIVGSGVWSDAGNFAAGSPLVVDGSGSPLVLDRGNNHLYRYIVGSGVWSDIGNFGAGSPLVVDGSGSPIVFDRGNNHLYRYVVSSGIWNDIGNFAAGSPLVVDGSGSPVVLNCGNGHLYRYIVGSGGSLLVFVSKEVGAIDGIGDTIVNDGASLTADHILQNALVIGGDGANSTTVTIVASNAFGNSLTASGGSSSSAVASNPGVWSDAGNFATGSSLVVDGSGSPLVLDRGNNHLYRYIVGSGVWSDIGNFASGSPLVVDGSGSPVVLDRGNNHLYRYIVGSAVWSDIGTFAANSVLQVAPAGSLVALDSAAHQLVQYAAGSSSAAIISDSVASFQIAPNSAIYYLKSNGDLMSWTGGKTMLIDVLVTQYSINASGTLLYTTWFQQNLLDIGLRSLVYADYLTERSLNRADMIRIFTEVEGDGIVSASEFHDLQALVATPSLLSMPSYVASLASEVVDGDGDAHQPFEGIPLGNLAAGDSGAKLNQLVGKWFYGTDLPTTYVPDAGHYYAYAEADISASLFNVNGPSYQDVRQGAMGDCWLLASFAAVAARNPMAIRDMFIDNQDGTYTVHLHEPDAGDPNVFHDYYTTVDRLLPTTTVVNSKIPIVIKGVPAGTLFDIVYTYYVSNGVAAPSSELWVALLEKAFAQTTEEGWLQRDFPGRYSGGPIGSYSALDGGFGYEALSVLAGAPASSSYVGAVQGLPPFDGALGFAAAGDYAVLDTDAHAGLDANGVVGSHVYAVIGSSGNSALTLFNPWGMTNTGARGWYDASFGWCFTWAQTTLTYDQINQSFDDGNWAASDFSIGALCQPVSIRAMSASPSMPNESLNSTASPTGIAFVMHSPCEVFRTEPMRKTEASAEHSRRLWSATDCLLEDESLMVGRFDKDLRGFLLSRG